MYIFLLELNWMLATTNNFYLLVDKLRNKYQEILERYLLKTMGML